MNINEWWRNATDEQKNTLMKEALTGKEAPYCTDIAAAWEIHHIMCKALFSTRREYLKKIQHYSWMKTGLTVAWPDVLVVLKDDLPDAICLSALLARGMVHVKDEAGETGDR